MRDSENQLFEDEERNRLLEAIEKQARSLSMARGAEEHRLSDWLNAAEEVMPEVKKPAMKPMSAAMSSASPSRNLGSLLGMMLAGSMAIALAAGGGFAYVKLTEQVTALQQENQALTERLAQLEQATAQMDAAASSSAPAMTAGMTREMEMPPGSGVSAEYLDARLKEQTQLLQAALDTRFQQMLSQLEGRSVAAGQAAVPAVTVPVMTISAPAPAAAASPNAPAVPQTSAPTLSVPAAPEPVVEVKVVGDGARGQHSGEGWLTAQPEGNFILQLASSPYADGLETMARKIKTSPDDAHVVPVSANGGTRYILVYGSFADRNDARKAADSVRLDLGTTPWVRRIGDVQKLVEGKR